MGETDSKNNDSVSIKDFENTKSRILIENNRKIFNAERKSMNRKVKIARNSANLFIASSFTATVLLLSFITLRTLILELSITFLLISIFFMLELYFFSITTESKLVGFEELPDDKTKKYMYIMLRKSMVIELSTRGGLIFFYLGIIFLAFYFNIGFFGIPAIVYLWIKFVLSQYNEISEWRFSKSWEKAYTLTQRTLWRFIEGKNREKKIPDDALSYHVFIYKIRLQLAGIIIGIILRLIFFIITILFFIYICFTLF